jgi:hypothetical protein
MQPWSSSKADFSRELNHANMRCHEISADRRRAGDLDHHRSSSLCLRSSAGDAVCGPSRTAGPVADLHCVGPKRLCRCACRMESRRSRANKYQLSGPQGEVINLGQGIIAHDGTFQLGQTGPDGSNMSMPYSAKLTDKLTMVLQQRAKLNGNPVPQIKFLYAAPLQSLPAGFQCGVFVIAVSGTATPGDALGIFCSLPEDRLQFFKNFLTLDRPRPP